MKKWLAKSPILNLALPSILSNLTVPLLGIVDTAVVGHLDKASYLGAIGLGGVAFNLVFWSLGFLRMGTTGITSNAFGANNLNKAQLTLIRAWIIAGALGLLLLSFRYPISRVVISLVDGSPDTIAYATSYFNIRIMAAPATLGVIALSGWFLGMQNARIPLLLALFGNLINVGLDILFVYQFGMQSDGVAWGTVIAQYATFGLGLVLLLRFDPGIRRVLLRKEIFQLTALREFAEINANILLRTLSLGLVFYMFIASSARQGDDVLAANQILLQLIYVLSYGVDGFAYAAESLVGKHLGGGQRDRIMRTIKACMAWGMGIGSILALFYACTGSWVLAIFTANPEVLATATPFLPWLVAACIANSFGYIWDGVFIGLTAAKAMRNTMFMATFLVFFPLWYWLPDSTAPHQLWIAFTAYNASRGLLMAWWFQHYKHRWIAGKAQAMQS